MKLWAWLQGKKTKAAIVLTDNHPVNCLSDNISAGAV